jgi:vancomycin resistance protein YoaR
VEIDPEEISERFAEVAVLTGAERRLNLQGQATEPAFTTADAKALKITERVSTFTTNFPYAEYRNVNLPRAAELIDGTVLRPGETFSLNDTVGERTVENGFTEGYIVSDGIFRKDLGGGVSQIATTTFNAMYFAGLKDVEHKPHSVYIDRYPEGREATVAWPTVDLRFTNTTPYGVLIKAKVRKSTPSSEGAATVSMYSTKHWKITSRNGPAHRLPLAPGPLPHRRRLRGGERDLRFQRGRLPHLPRPRVWQGAPQGEVPHRLHRGRHRPLRGTAEAEA